MKVMAALVAFMFAVLTTRLWFLQVLASERFARLADQNQVRLVPVDPLRGEIVDRNGKVLVGNRPSTVVRVDRLEVKGKEEQVLYRLHELLDIPVSELMQRLRSVKYLPYQPIPVAEDVSKEDVFYIREHQKLFPGVSYELAATRDYPMGKVGAHLLGYLGEISQEQLDSGSYEDYRPGELVGESGVEAEYERYLHGESGTRVIQVNAQGRVLDDNFASVPPKKGYTLMLSVDRDVQLLAETSLRLGIKLARNLADEDGKRLKATGGAVLVMNPKNGQVLALASNPSYDPSFFLRDFSSREYQKRFTLPSSRHPLFNRAIQGQYPPGSTFKPFVAAAALKQGIAGREERYHCPPEYTAPGDESGTVFHNWSPKDYGYITLAESLVISCDTVFYQFGWQFWKRYERSGRRDEVMQRNLKAMGFGRPTGIDLPSEEPGVVPIERYKEALFKSNPEVFGPYPGWYPGDNINLSVGQGFSLTTPVQIAMTYSALANGGILYEPHLGWQIRGPDGRPNRVIRPRSRGRLPISRANIAYLRQSLVGVTREGGTAAFAFKGFPHSEIPVAGKTGTAEIKPRQPYSWFAAMAPAGRPRYVVVAMVEQGGHGSTTAAPVVRRILEGLFGLKPPDELHAGSVAD